MTYARRTWGRSSTGRASASHAEGREFDSHRLHHDARRISSVARAAACRAEGRGLESRMRRQTHQGVAQSEESSLRKGEAAGSSPATLTTSRRGSPIGRGTSLRIWSVRVRPPPPVPQHTVVAQSEERCRAKAGAEVRVLSTVPLTQRRASRQTRRVGRTGRQLSRKQRSHESESGFESLALRQLLLRGGETGSHAGLYPRVPLTGRAGSNPARGANAGVAQWQSHGFVTRRRRFDSGPRPQTSRGSSDRRAPE